MQRIPAPTVLTGPRTDPTTMKVSTNADVGSRVSEAAHPGSAGSSETCTVIPTSRGGLVSLRPRHIEYS